MSAFKKNKRTSDMPKFALYFISLLKKYLKSCKNPVPSFPVHILPFFLFNCLGISRKKKTLLIYSYIRICIILSYHV